MIRKKTTLKAKSGGVQTGNGAGHPRTLIDLAAYREHHAHVGFLPSGTATFKKTYDSEYSGWSNGSRPRNQAITLRSPNVHST